MTWKKQTITNWPELRDKLNELAATDNIVCRGQGSDYDNGAIFSTLDRTFKDTNITDEKQKGEVEREIARRFLIYAPNYLPYAELMHLSDGPSFLMLMQHYGAPTRLVDWTYSIWLGAYFAARSKFDKDGIIWVFNSEVLTTHAHKTYGDETKNAPETGKEGLPKLMWESYKPWVCLLMRRGPQIPRMIAQQGLFTVGGRLGVDHCKSIDEIVPDSVESQGKQIISFEAKLKPEILKALHRMGINGSTLFPGIDGVGKALTEYAHFPQSQRAK
jgi:hypothetical protein